MERTARMPWAVVAALYAYGLLGMSLVGLLSPLAARITGDLGTPKESIGLIIALFSLPPAITATIGGSLIDRIGPRRALLAAPLLIVLADVLTATASSLWIVGLAMIVAGIGYVGLVVAVPAMMIASLEGPIRARALAFWSTHAPTGFSVGLLLAAPFTVSLDWRIAFGLHGVLTVAVLLAAAMLLPRIVPPTGLRENGFAQLARVLRAVRDPAAARLALAMAMPNMISYGTSLAAVGYLSKVHGVSLAASATTVAAAKIAAILFGGTLMGSLLAHNARPRRLFIAVVTTGIVAQTLLFLPWSPLPLAVAGLMLWLFAFGGQSGICMATLPSLTGRDLQGGTLAGLVNQSISIGSFLTPAIYFALPGWAGFVALAIVGSLISLAALPAPRHTPVAA